MITKTEQEIQIEQTLAEKLKQQQSGQNHPFSFAQWMERCLYTPELGYYQNPKPKFGPEGDFMTAPIIQPLFGLCLANFCSMLISELKLPKHIAEFGPGEGALAHQLLSHTPCDNYYCIDTSPALQAIQAQTLSSFTQCHWQDQLPQNFEGIIIANEVIDAIPAERFQWSTNKPGYLGVEQRDNQWQWTQCEPPIEHEQQWTSLLNQLSEYDLPEGYIGEYRPMLEQWLGPILSRLHKGAVIIIDYGYDAERLYHPERTDGTLACFFHHQAHNDPLTNAGIQDISVHVDFSQLIDIAERYQCSVTHYSTQAQFLLEQGILQLAAQASNSKGLDTLLDVQMGGTIKVLILEKN